MMLEARKVSVKVGIRDIIQDVDFFIKRGEINLLTGPNGSGKSTVFRTMAGLVKAHSGSIYLDGVDITDYPPHQRYRMGIVLAPEKMRVAENLTVEENIRIGGEIERVYDLFPKLRRLRNHKAKNLSGGERQMVVFGRAIASNPKYLLLDEPFQGLHGDAGDIVLEEIQRIKKRAGIAVISHERVEDLIEISSRITLMISGKVIHSREITSSDEVIKKLREYLLI
ncbi:ABC-type branched-chain amino acid transport systems, ATPase component [Archaeoglobus sulfaticallidus PM70-1]|uniref:ABC-type branched-chain amino acid transport systems, ATPase component n=1 Tax=Archaeoglobus sulfaticallidus PM70-1 TaxID=387631 RepID=N0BIH2_9EURY|nr:ABC-type branched-chain amino acid transport systems, ATPase component [Archaeoglobus sulfaticallidus PM70-1]